MKRHTSILTGVLLLVVLHGALPVQATAGDSSAIVLITNKSNPVDAVSLDEARKIFLGDKTTWANGKKVLVVMRSSGSPERNAVLKSVYKMSDGDYSKYFLQAAFTGKVQAPPKEVGSAADMLHYVAQIPGAVGYVKAGDADASVKVVLELR